MIRFIQLFKSWQKVTAGGIFILSILSQASAQETGRLFGSLVDADTGEPIIAAHVSLENSDYSTMSTLSGEYRLPDVAEGNYTILIEKYGYRTARITDVQIESGALKSMDIPLTANADNLIELEAFVVRASDVQDLGMKLLADRKEAPAISDAIGADDFSKFGAGDAADAMSKVTGVSINDGKYVFVRGLGERYSNTLMNGVSLPSADPNKKAVQMDMFPTDLLESIVTVKAFTPDKPGDFTGGSVDIQTKSFPDLFSFNLSTSVGYNANANLNGDFLSYDGGDTDLLGFDDGTRDIPEGISTNPTDWPGSVFDFKFQKETGTWPSEYYDRATRAFSSILAASPKDSFLNQGLSFDLGNSHFVGQDALIGYVVSLTYDHGYDFYSDGINARYEQSSLSTGAALTPKYVYNDTRAVESAQIGFLTSLAYQPNTNHEVNLIYTMTQSMEDESRYQVGPSTASGSSVGAVDEVRSIIFTERNINSLQLKGNSFLEGSDIKFDWNGTLTSTSQREPDVRMINNEWYEGTNERSLVKPNRAPRRIWRDLKEDRWSVGLNVEIPFFKKEGLSRNFKLGGNLQQTDREFDEIGFTYQKGYGGAIFSDFEDAYTFLDEENIGIIDQEGNPLAAMGNYITLNRSALQSYIGDEKITAYYGMLDFEINDKWRLVGGARQENSELNVQNTSAFFDERFNDPEGHISENRLLPSLHLIHSLSENTNIRVAATKTLARPTLREMAPYRSFDSIDGDEFIGNQSLRMTEVENLDLRWEWFPNPGEIVAVSLFSKKMTDAIESSYREQGGSTILQFVNSDNGQVYGVEVEFNKTLGFISEYLENVSINSNFTYTKSEVDITLGERISKAPYFGDDVPNDISIIGFDTSELTEDQITRAEESLINTPSTRRLFGQPDYIFNLSTQYTSNDTKFSASLNYNYVGDKIAQVSAGPTPDIFQKARGQLDLIMHYNLATRWKLKFSAKNLTDSVYEAYYDTDDQEIFSQYKKGVTFSIGATYRFD